MKKKSIVKHLLSLVALLFLVACATVPITGRQQLNLIPAETMLSMSFAEYDTFIKSNPPSSNQQQLEMVKRVGSRVQVAVETYLAQNNMSQLIEGYNWEFNLVDSDEPNAWCMPGGKVVVYSGILPLTQNESGLAVVVGHEIAHAIARHGNERMSQQLLTQLGGVALDVALEEKSEETRFWWQAAYGLGSQVGVLLPFSRLHESEADRLGLIFMAMAGYNPATAVDFWSRMAAKSGGGMPEFLSTHPSDETRIQNIKNLLPEANQYYKP